MGLHHYQNNGNNPQTKKLRTVKINYRPTFKAELENNRAWKVVYEDS
jgi:hypothetical protein